VTRPLGYDDEPQGSGAVVAVHYGDYRRQEIWVASGANVGNWYCLGGEFGVPKTVDDPRSDMDKLTENMLGRKGLSWTQPPGTLPLHPTWSDVLARGPVTLLFPGADDTYAAGWRAGRRELWNSMENELDDDPPNTPGIAS
jgi:hypothetical protein